MFLRLCLIRRSFEQYTTHRFPFASRLRGQITARQWNGLVIDCNLKCTYPDKSLGLGVLEVAVDCFWNLDGVDSLLAAEDSGNGEPAPLKRHSGPNLG